MAKCWLETGKILIAVFIIISSVSNRDSNCSGPARCDDWVEQKAEANLRASDVNMEM